MTKTIRREIPELLCEAEGWPSDVPSQTPKHLQNNSNHSRSVDNRPYRRCRGRTVDAEPCRGRIRVCRTARARPICAHRSTIRSNFSTLSHAQTPPPALPIPSPIMSSPSPSFLLPLPSMCRVQVEVAKSESSRAPLAKTNPCRGRAGCTAWSSRPCWWRCGRGRSRTVMSALVVRRSRRRAHHFER